MEKKTKGKLRVQNRINWRIKWHNHTPKEEIDSITAEIVKAGGANLESRICKLVQRVWKQARENHIFFQYTKKERKLQVEKQT